jgi:hypothetical protein
MPGKYARFRGKYPLVPPDSKWQVKVEAVKQAECLAKTPEQLLFEYDQFRLQKDVLEDKISDLNIEIAAREQQLVKILMERGMESLKLQTGVSGSIKDDVYASEEHRPTFFGWVRKTGQEALFTVHHSTYNAIVKQLLMNGQPTPPGLKIFTKQSINWRNPNRKKKEGEENGEE